MRTRRRIEDSASYVRVVGDVAFVDLMHGKVAVIDAADAVEVGKRLWCMDARNGSYAVTNIYAKDGKRQKSLKLHRFLMDAPEGMEVDHANGNKLDNRRANLRVCTRDQNARNVKPLVLMKRKPVTCPYKGVRVAPYSGKYVAVICANRRTRHLGTFSTALGAARAYDRAARELHGEFARTNF